MSFGGSCGKLLAKMFIEYERPAFFLSAGQANTPKNAEFVAVSFSGGRYRGA